MNTDTVCTHFYVNCFQPRNIYRFGTEVFDPLRTKRICFI